MNIGIFDSGLGGLTIFKELIFKLPQYNYIYLGDNARVPYGGRSSDIIYKFTKQALDYLFRKDCLLVILACNTSTAAALRRIQQEYLPKHYPDRRVLGVIKPTVEVVADSDAKRVGVIGTRATVQSGSFVKEINKLNPAIRVFQNAGPLLVPFIEEGEINSPVFRLILRQYLDPLLSNNIDTLILGCTHYGLINNHIQQLIGSSVQVVSEGPIVGLKLMAYLERHSEIEKKLEKKGRKTYLVTDNKQNYETMVKIFLGEEYSETAQLKGIKLG